MIICDSREKKNQHILRYFKANGIDFEIKKLDVADYVLATAACSDLQQAKIAIDRKQNLNELATNLMNKNDKSRFWREIRRAKEQNTKIIVLCEHGQNIRELHDVCKWQSKFSTVSGRKLADEMNRLKFSYGVDFVFCNKAETAQKIIEILGVTKNA